MLKTTPPSAVSDLLARHGTKYEDLLLCASTDIDRLGHYAPRWLVVTAERLWVIAEDPPEVLLELALNDATEYRCQAMIGSGCLQARVDGLFIEVLHYSNRLADQFNKIARKLDRFLHGEPIVIHPEDDTDPRRCKSCGLMLGFVGDVCPRCVNKGAVMARMWELMGPYRNAAILMMGLLIIGIGLDLVGPRLTQFMFDHVLLTKGDVGGTPVGALDFFRGHPLRVLMLIVAVLAFVQISRMFINVINGKLGSKIGTAITFDMRGRLLNHLQQLSVAYYDRQQVGSIVGRVAYDTEALHGFVGQITGGFLYQILMVIGVGVMMFSINVKLALFTLIPAPLVITGSIIFWRYIYPRYYRFWDASSKQAGMLSGVLSGIRVVKAFSQEEREMQRFNKASNHLRQTRRTVDYSMALFNPVMGLIFQFGGWIVWYVGGQDVLLDNMTPGALIAFFGYQGMFYGPLNTLTQFTNWLTQFATQAHRIFEILDTPVEITDAAKPTPLPDMQGRITFENVTFGYNRHNPVLRDVDLDIAPGEMIGIVGRSGSGKTTIINLLSRFYDVNEGRVLIDGLDVRDIQRDDLRRQVGVVLQEPFLFRGSIWQNVVYGKPTATPEEVLTASKAGNAHDFIMRQSHGYDTWVGERGAGLSGGERQRIGISRVLLTDPRILILDEATSSVDAESEASIQAALAEVVKGRTTIAIAHRLSTLRNANRIMVVDNGRITESGTHEELLKTDGLYSHLIKIQGQLAAPTVETLTTQMGRDADAAPETDVPHNGPLPPLKSHHTRWLTPKTARIHLGNLHALHVTVPDEGIYGGIFALRCMPVHHPTRFISLRYLDEEKREVEVGIIRDLKEWDEPTQQLVREALLRRYFVHTITAIHEIKVYNGYLNFQVETDLGPMEFMLRWQGDRAHDYGANGKMLLDTDENRYLIPDLAALPDRDRRLFMRYIYW